MEAETDSQRSGGAQALRSCLHLRALGIPHVLRLGDGEGQVAEILPRGEEPGRRVEVAVPPDGAELLEEVPVRACVRRGQAIDLVLDRGRENRSQVVFTTIRGREGIFWQSPKTAKQARPATRLPARRASAVRSLVIAIDTREHYPYRFSKQGVTTKRQPLPCGDYGVLHENEFIAVVERKALSDLAKCLVDGSLAFAMSELAAMDRAGVVVEERYAAVFELPHVTSGFVPDLLGAIQVRYPQVPIVFCDARSLAEEWTYRFLGAALAGRREGIQFDDQ